MKLLRIVFWLLLLCALAAAVVWLGRNDAVVSVFWSPWRVDVALNVVVLALVVGITAVLLALRGMRALAQLPAASRARRVQQQRSELVAALAAAIAHQQASRHAQARQEAQVAAAACEHLRSLGADVAPAWPLLGLQAAAELLAASSAHAEHDNAARDAHHGTLDKLLAAASPNAAAETLHALREALGLQAARCALDDGDPEAALTHVRRLDKPSAAALRLQLQASRASGQWPAAIEAARRLAASGALPEVDAAALIHSLQLQSVRSAGSEHALRVIYASWGEIERATPTLAAAAAQRLIALSTADDTDSAQRARDWLHPAWTAHFQHLPSQAQPDPVTDALIAAATACMDGCDEAWLGLMQRSADDHPHIPQLLYVLGLASAQRQQWAQAAQQLEQALQSSPDAPWRVAALATLALLAEQNSQAERAAPLWRQAALGAASLPAMRLPTGSASEPNGA